MLRTLVSRFLKQLPKTSIIFVLKTFGTSISVHHLKNVSFNYSTTQHYYDATLNPYLSTK